MKDVTPISSLPVTKSLRLYGAVGDGVTDDSSAIEVALESGNLIDGEGLTYFIGTAFTVTNKEVRLKNAHLLIDADIAGIAITLDTSVKATTTLDTSSTVQENDAQVTLASSSGMEAGDLVHIYGDDQSSGSLTIGESYVITAAGGTFTGVGAADNNAGTDFVATGTTPTWGTGSVKLMWSNDPRPGTGEGNNAVPGETHIITEVNSPQIVFEDRVSTEYVSGSSVTVDAYEPLEHSFDNVTFEVDDYTIANGVTCIYINRSAAVNVSNCKFIGANNTGLANTIGTNVTVTGTEFRHCKRITTGNGYGAQLWTVNHARFDACYGLECRRAIDFSGVQGQSRNGIISNGNFIGQEGASGSCIGTHGGAEDIIFTGNVINGGDIGIQNRGNRISILGNLFQNIEQTAVTTNDGNAVTVMGNTNYGNRGATSGQANFLLVYASSRFTNDEPLVIRNNEVYGIRNSIIEFFTDVDGLYCYDNTFQLWSNSGGNATYVYEDRGSYTITNAKTGPNRIHDKVGTFNEYHTDLTIPYSLRGYTYGAFWHLPTGSTQLVGDTNITATRNDDSNGTYGDIYILSNSSGSSQNFGFSYTGSDGTWSTGRRCKVVLTMKADASSGLDGAWVGWADGLSEFTYEERPQFTADGTWQEVAIYVDPEVTTYDRDLRIRFFTTETGTTKAQMDDGEELFLAKVIVMQEVEN